MDYLGLTGNSTQQDTDRLEISSERTPFDPRLLAECFAEMGIPAPELVIDSDRCVPAPTLAARSIMQCDNIPGNPPFLVNTYGVTYNASGGNPGGYISSTDPSTNWWWFSAPAAFLGDKSSYYGGTLSLDLLVVANDNLAYPVVALVGNGMTLYHAPAAPPTPNAWTPYSLPLTAPAGWRTSGTYLPATEAQLRQVLSDLDALYVDGDWATAGTENTGLDNVRLAEPETIVTAVPEPRSLVLFGLGLVSCAVAGRVGRKGK